MSSDKKILIIQTAFPGDALLTLPFIQELKKKNPDYLIDVLCIPVTAEIFAASPYINESIPLAKRGEQKSFFAFLKFIKSIKSNNFDIVYSPHRSFRSALIALNISAKESYGFDNSTFKFAFKSLVKYDYSAHEIKRNLEFIEGNYDEDKWKIIPEIVVSVESENKINKFLSDSGIKKFIAIAPGSVWATKKYPVEYYKRITSHFSESHYGIILVGGKEDKDICESIKAENNKNVFISAGEFSFIETIELLKYSSLLICNDSAPTHLGMCADIRVLTIYCSTSPQFGFYPYNSKSDYISYDNLFCKPCGIHGYDHCPLGTFDCAKSLLPEMVIKKAERLLEDDR